jgi:hypothetical protein
MKFRSSRARFKRQYEWRPGSNALNRRRRAMGNFEPGFRQTWSGHRTRRDALAAGVKVPTLQTERT